MKKVLFLVYPSKAYKILPITTCTLSKNLRKTPYYLCYKEFAKRTALILNRRLPDNSFKNKLFIKQKGLCGECNLPLTESEPPGHKNIFESQSYKDEDYKSDNDMLEIHHIKPIAEGYKTTQKLQDHEKSGISRGIFDSSGLHQKCHQLLTDLS